MDKQKSKEAVVEEFRIESIQDAAMRVIARKGVAGASMQEIAEEAGVAKGTIYLYFENQRDLLERTVDHAFSRLLELLERAIDGEGTYRERLETLIRTKLGFLSENGTLLRLYAITKYPDGDTSKARCDRKMRPQFQRYVVRLESFLTEGMEAGEFKRAPAHRLAIFLEEGMVALMMARFDDPEASAIEQDVEWLLETIFNGIAK